MNPALDDLDARPGSTTSLVRTIVGLYIRELGGWISSTHLIALMDALGTSAQVTRTAITRLKKKGILEPRVVDEASGFALTESGERILARGDRRIFEPRSMGTHDQWCLLSYSMPESQRERRHQLRKHLHGVGGGLVAPGLWIFPEYLRTELWEILESLGLQDHATVFVSPSPEMTGNMLDAASTWWDLESLAELHRTFISLNHAVSSAGHPEESGSFATYVRAIDSWRTIPYLDPGLPPHCLPANWPGNDSARLFLRIQASHADAARTFVQTHR